MTVQPGGTQEGDRQTLDAAGAQFPYRPESVGEARKILGEELRRLAVAQPVADDAVLVLSELVSNALRHARPLEGGTIRVAWWTLDDRVLRIEVTDGGASGAKTAGMAEAPDPESLEEVDESAVDGRGLGIVGALAEEWGVASESSGDPSAPKTVWAAIRIRARHAAPQPPDKPRWDRLRHLRFARRGKGGGEAPWAMGHPVRAWIPRSVT